MSKERRRFTPEFRVSVAKRILDGESVSAIHHEFGIKRSVLYRWRDAYRKEGRVGLERQVGRPSSKGSRPVPAAATEVEQLRQQVEELQRKVGQQAMQLDFFRGAFKRVKEEMPSNGGAGANSSTPKSGR